MEAQTLTAEVREKSGKGPARQLRMSGRIPAVIYGLGRDPAKLIVSPVELSRALSGEYGRNQLVELVHGELRQLALIKDLDVHPVTREIRHVDFFRVSRDRAVVTDVPFETKGRSVGVQRGGVLRKLFRTLPVSAFPQDVPAKIVLDVGPLDLGAIVKVSDLPLPAGVSVTFAPDRRVLFVEAKETRVAKDEEEEGAPGAKPGAKPAAKAG